MGTRATISIHTPASRFKPNYTLLNVDPHNSAICVRSYQCTGIVYGLIVCSSYQSIGHLVERVEDHARKLPVNMDRASLIHRQSEQKLEVIEKILKKEKLSVCVFSSYQIIF